MNPVLQAAIGSIVRHGLMFVASYFVTKGIWTEAEATTYVMGASLAIVTTAWAIWQKSKAHAKIEQALRLPAHSSLEDLK